MEEQRLTPMMVQYRQIKEKNQDKVLFFRLGDFYEMFDEDAVEVSRLLNLTLTKRNTQPMCGIPYHAAKVYIKRLLDAGKKIAICEQTELPQDGKQLAKREVVQVVSPATVVEEDFLEDKNSSYVFCISLQKQSIAIAYADITTGEFFVRELARDVQATQLQALLQQIAPREIVVNEDDYFLDQNFAQILDRREAMISKLPSWFFSIPQAHQLLCEHFETNSLKAFGLEGDSRLLSSGGALLRYLQDAAKTSLQQIHGISILGDETFLEIDEASRKSLELITNLDDGSTKHSLFSAIDDTLTRSGTRLLKSWIVSPLIDRQKILERQDWVTLYLEDRQELNRVRTILKEVLDLSRLSSRISMNRHLPKDLVGIAQTLRSFIALIDQRYLKLLPLEISQGTLKSLLDLVQDISLAINDECLGPFEEGKVILTGFDQNLDNLRKIKNGGRELLDAYLTEIKNETGITTLKLSSNKILGHYLEVSKGQAEKVPAHFYRKQTLVNAERFTSDRLVAIEQELLGSAFASEKREREVYEALVERCRMYQRELQAIGLFLCQVDCLQSFATTAIKHSYCKPEFSEQDVLKIQGGRHPVVEQQLGIGQFVANDLVIDAQGHRFCLITGPNMAGKSTYLRQTALIVLLAQIGSYVPATTTELGLVDRLFCRVGASDNLSRGESTFLIEMQEAAHILRTSKRHSLVIIDELGRGTSTQDGMSIAYAVMQQLLEMGPKTLFATHYHELAHVDTSMIQLLTLQVLEQGGHIRFLRKVIEGIANSSYGLNVAKMAGVNPKVLKEARSFQKKHFAEYGLGSMQLELFNNQGCEDPETLYFSEAEQEVLSEIRDFLVEQSTPMDAIVFLKHLQTKLEAHS